MEFWSSPPLADLAAATALIADIRRHSRNAGSFNGDRILRNGRCLSGLAPSSMWTWSIAEQRSVSCFAYRGRGLARDAVEALIGFAFMTMELHRLEADTDPRNQRSLKLLERQGFRRRGVPARTMASSGPSGRRDLLGLLRREWSPGDRACEQHRD